MWVWTPEGFIRSLERNDYSPEDIITNTIEAVEKQAKAVLINDGYGVDDCYLTHGRSDVDRREWLNEASQLIHYSNLPFVVEQAAHALIEASIIFDLLAAGKMNEAVVSMAKLVAVSLLPNDESSGKILHQYSQEKIRSAEWVKKGGKWSRFESFEKFAKDFAKNIWEEEKQRKERFSSLKQMIKLVVSEYGKRSTNLVPEERTIRTYLKQVAPDEVSTPGYRGNPIKN